MFESDKWTRKQEKEALTALCTLKRALGISDHKTSKDEFRDEILYVHTPNLESAELIAELFHKYAGCKKVVPVGPVPPQEPIPMRNTVRAGHVVPGDDYCASITLKNPSEFARAIHKIVEKHIAPDRRFTR